MKHLMSICALLALTSALSVQGGTATADECRDILIQDTASSAENLQKEIAFYSLITSEEDYNKAIAAGASGSYGAFSASGNYSEFQQKRQALLNNQSSSVSEKYASRQLNAYLNPEQTAAWLQCQLKDQKGVRVIAKNISDDGATIVLIVRGPGTGSFHYEPQIEIIGASGDVTSIKSVMEQPINANSDRSAFIRRTKDQPLRFIANVDGATDDIFIEWPKPVPVPPPHADPVFEVGGLTVQGKRSDVELNWSQAAQQCKSITYDNKQGWRLPTKSELADVVAFVQGHTDLLNKYSVGNAFWSSETTPSDGNRAWYGQFGPQSWVVVDGDKAATQNLRAWCVH